jgi:hypothetical protein
MELVWALLILAGFGGLAFVIYFYAAKGNAQREAERKTELRPKQAEEIVQQYGAALAKGCREGGIARYESYLPCSKAKIKQAVKLFLAWQIEHKSLLKEPTETLLGAVAALNSFLPDDQADRVNQSRRTPDDPEFWDAMKNVVSFEIREEMDEFIAEVQKWDTNDPLFHQRVYTLIGLEYSSAIEKGYRDFFFDHS